MKPVWRVLIAVGIAGAICVLAQWIPDVVHFIHRAVVIQLTLLILSILAIAILGKGNFKDYGFRLPGKMAWLRPILLALLLGCVSSLIILLSRAGGHPVSGKLSFIQIVLFIWLLASFCEEVFMRGFLQSYLSPLGQRSIKLFVPTPLPVFISAVVFSAMHLVLLFAGASLLTTAIILLFTFGLGLLAGHVRVLSGSILPAFVVHFFGNVGGMLGGILYAMGTFIITGAPPQM